MQSDYICLRPTGKEALQENEINYSKFGVYTGMLSPVCFEMNEMGGQHIFPCLAWDLISPLPI